jgi:para-aminobenzoate synthetase component 1
LRQCNPAPFAGYLDMGEFVLASASPERFLRVDKGEVEARPIKGTRPRMADPAQDAAWRATNTCTTWCRKFEAGCARGLARSIF